jgi:isopentenyl-diphosphate delta-isomerase
MMELFYETITIDVYSGALHRAFSVFLFNNRNELLLQRRSLHKITFPDVWSNACCSHPLYNTDETIDDNSIGIRRAAIRKLHHELGIVSLNIDQLHLVGRFLYRAKSDEKWGENELDYALIVRNFDNSIVPNADEVADVRFVDRRRLDEMIGWCMLLFVIVFFFV